MQRRGLMCNSSGYVTVPRTAPCSWPLPAMHPALRVHAAVQHHCMHANTRHAGRQNYYEVLQVPVDADEGEAGPPRLTCVMFLLPCPGHDNNPCNLIMSSLNVGSLTLSSVSLMLELRFELKRAQAHTISAKVDCVGSCVQRPHVLRVRQEGRRGATKPGTTKPVARIQSSQNLSLV